MFNINESISIADQLDSEKWQNGNRMKVLWKLDFRVFIVHKCPGLMTIWVKVLWKNMPETRDMAKIKCTHNNYETKNVPVGQCNVIKLQT